MSSSPARGPASRVLRVHALALSVLVAGGLVGTMEGWIYPDATGPRAPLYSYWAFMMGVLFLVLVGTLSWFTNAARDRVLLTGLALVLMPAALVVQDAASLMGQGQFPWTATWYAVVFGDSPLTRHYAGLPGWYYGGFALTFVLLAFIARAAPPARVTRA